jgi:hypothetical protein
MARPRSSQSATFRFTCALLLVLPLLWAHGAAAQTITSTLFGQSAAANGHYGQSVRDAGDLNHDGEPDLVIGAPLDSRSGLDKGRAFVFFGGTQARLQLEGTGTQEHFGYAVGGIGDVNGDGFDDLAVGAPFNNAIAAEAGRVYVFFGGDPMDTTPDLILSGEIAGDHFGWSLTRGGDLNDDGKPDFLVGAPLANAPGLDQGAVYLYLGASGTPSSTAARRFSGEVAGDQFGFSVADVPNFKGDGTPAFLVGAPYKNQPITNGGRAYLFFAGSNGALPASTASVEFLPPSGYPSADPYLGWSVSQAGNFDAGTRTDVAIGAPGYLAEKGYAAIYYGAALPSAQPSPDQVIVGETGGDRFGEALADVGDFAGSDRTDLVVGAPSRDVPGQNAGVAYFFAGGFSYTLASQGTPVTRGALALRVPSGDLLGTSISFIGDLDGDGKPEFAVGAPLGNNPSDALSGYVGLISSAGIPLPVLPTRMEQHPLGDGGLELRFDGQVVDAQRAVLLAIGNGTRVLAELGQGLSRQDVALVGRFDRSQIESVDQVELQWSLDAEGLTRSENFSLSLPTLGFQLLPPRPNPFNPSTDVSFELPQAMQVRLRVIDAKGRQVRRLFEGVAGPGRVSVHFDGRDGRGRVLASGVYTFVIESERAQDSVRALLLK